MRNARLIMAATLLCTPTIAVAFQTTEDILWPAEGRFPAYPKEPDERRIRYSVSGGLYHDSNLFRLSDTVNPQAVLGTTDKSDTVARIGLGLKADLPVSRQRLLLDAKVDDYKYDRFGFLDHAEYRAGATWQWQVTSLWSGDVGYNRQRYLASLAELQSRTKDLITVDHAFANAGYLLTPRWRARGGLDRYEYSHGDVTLNTLENRTNSATAGLDYLTPGGNSVGGQVKYTNGQYPNRQLVAGSLVDNEYNETETSAVTHWVVTGKSTLDARLGYTNRTHKQVPQRNFSGATGRLSYDWTPGAKTLLNFSAWRELRAVEEIAASYVLSKGISFGPNWAPTPKLVFQARLLRETRDYDGDPGFALAGAPKREDVFRGARLSAGYTPRRNIELAIAVEKGERDSNIVGRDYDYNTVSANAKLSF